MSTKKGNNAFSHVPILFVVITFIGLLTFRNTLTEKWQKTFLC